MKNGYAGLLIGYGSIGRHHARVMAAETPSFTVVEKNEAALRQAATDYKLITAVESLEALDQARFPWNFSVAVIATWGPSHSSLFHSLADRGVKHILCEKPLASSMEGALEMVRRSKEEGITLAVNHYIRYSGFAAALKEFARQHDLGEPVSLIVDGGAGCLVTNGLHWIDFGAELFNSYPARVISTAKGEQINPRSPDLDFYGGSAIWSFNDGREATFNLSNRSSVTLKGRVYYLNAMVDIDVDLNVVIRRRDMAATRMYPKVTRTGYTTETLFEGQLPGVLPLEDRLRVGLEDALGSKSRICTPEVGTLAVSACIGALISSNEGRSVELPVDPSSPSGKKLWPIS